MGRKESNQTNKQKLCKCGHSMKLPDVEIPFFHTIGTALKGKNSLPLRTNSWRGQVFSFKRHSHFEKGHNL